MKTALYLRLSLLIPIFIWGVCLLFLIIARAFPYLLLSLILLSLRFVVQGWATIKIFALSPVVMTIRSLNQHG
jgi:hypothetical protein